MNQKQKFSNSNPKYNIEFSLIEDTPRIDAVTPRSGARIALTYINGVPDVTKMSDKEVRIVADCAHWFERKSKSNPKYIDQLIEKQAYDKD